MIKFSKKFRCLSLFISFAFFILLSLACASGQVEGTVNTSVETDYPNDDVKVFVDAKWAEKELRGDWAPSYEGWINSFDVKVLNNSGKSIKINFEESNVYGQVPFLDGLQRYEQVGATPRPITVGNGFSTSFNMTGCMQWYLDSWVYNGQYHSRWETRPLSSSAFMTLAIEIDDKTYKWTAYSSFVDSRATKSETKKTESE